MKPSKEFKGNIGLERIYLRKMMNKHKDDITNVKASKEITRWKQNTDASTKFIKMPDGKKKLQEKEVLKRNDQLVGRLYGLLTEQRERKSHAYAPGWRRLASGGVVIDCYRQEDDQGMRFKELHNKRKQFDKKSNQIDAQNKRLLGHIMNVTSDLTAEAMRDSYQKSRAVSKILLNRIPATALHLKLVGESDDNEDASPYELYARTQRQKLQKKKDVKDDQFLLDNAYNFTSGYYTGGIDGDGTRGGVEHEALADLEFTFVKPNPYKPDYHPVVKIDGTRMRETLHQEVPREKPTTMDYLNKATYEEAVGVSAKADLNSERHNNEHSYLLNICHTCKDPLNIHIGQKRYVNKDSYYERTNPMPNLVSPTLLDPNYAHNTDRAVNNNKAAGNGTSIRPSSAGTVRPGSAGRKSQKDDRRPRSPYLIKEGRGQGQQSHSPGSASKMRKKLESEINIATVDVLDKYGRGLMETAGVSGTWFQQHTHTAKADHDDMGPGWNNDTNLNSSKERVRPASANSGLRQRPAMTNVPSTSFNPNSVPIASAHTLAQDRVEAETLIHSQSQGQQPQTQLLSKAQTQIHSSSPSKSTPKIAINSMTDGVRVMHMNRYSNIPPTDPPKLNRYGEVEEEEEKSVRTEDLPNQNLLPSPINDRYRAPPPDVPSPEHFNWQSEDRYKKGDTTKAPSAKPGAVAATIAQATRPQFQVRPKSASSLIAQNKPAPVLASNRNSTPNLTAVTKNNNSHGNSHSNNNNSSTGNAVGKLKQQLVTAQEMQQRARMMGTKLGKEIKNVEDYKSRTGYAVGSNAGGSSRGGGGSGGASPPMTPTTARQRASSSHSTATTPSDAAGVATAAGRSKPKTDIYGRRIIKAEKPILSVVDTVEDLELPDVLNTKGNHIVLRQNILCRTKILSKFSFDNHRLLKDDPTLHLPFNIRITDVGAILPESHFGSTYYIQTAAPTKHMEPEALAAGVKSRHNRLGSHVNDIITSRGVVVEAFYTIPAPQLSEEGTPNPPVKLHATLYFPIRQLRNLCIITGNDSLYGQLTHSIRSIAIKSTATQSTAATVEQVMKANPVNNHKPNDPPIEGGTGVYAALASGTHAHPPTIKNHYKGVLYSSLSDHLDPEHQELLCTMIMRNIELVYDTLLPTVPPKLALIMPM